MPEGKTIYVVLENTYGDELKKRGLKVAWRGKTAGMLVMVKPGT